MLDLEFISGNFLYDDLSSDKEFLRQYFKTKLEIRFLVYYFTFCDLYTFLGFQVFLQNFIDHTGFACSRRWLQLLLQKVKFVEQALIKASKAADFAALSEIRSGKFHLPVSCVRRK